jgi:Protein of unknown function (DUF3379)
MNCEEARLLIGADPRAQLPELEAHVRECPGCTHFREEMRSLDGYLRRAMERPPPPVAGARPRRSPAPWRQWALAASVVLATLALIGVWLLRPSETLAREVVAHVEREPESWIVAQHATAPEIDKALRSAGVELMVTSDQITYAHSCWFRGHYVPHLVLQTAQGPATVMILRHEHVRARHPFHEDGFTGVIVPDGQGSLAVLTRGEGDVEKLAGQMQQEVRWLPLAP